MLLGVPVIRQYEKYLSLLAFVGRAKKTKFCLHQGKDMEKITRVKEKASLSSWKGDPY